MKIVVIGAGISGVSIARMLSEKHEVQVIERSSKPGGLIKCERANGGLYHRVGGHVFNSKNPQVLNWFWKHFDKETEFVSATRNAKIWMDNQYIGYPIENHLHQLSPELTKNTISELLETHSCHSSIPCQNFKEFLLHNFGPTLYNAYFGPYNTKLWGSDLANIPLDWLEGKLPMPKAEDILLSNIHRSTESNMVHASFYYPAQDGSQFIIDRLSEGLNIRCNSPLEILKREGNQWRINNDIMADAIIYTGDIRKLPAILSEPGKDLQSVLSRSKKFKSRGTSSLFCEYEPSNDISWLYLPKEKLRCHRIIFTGNFNETNNSTSGKPTCVLEFSGIYSQSEMIEQLSELPIKLKPITCNQELNSYVMQDPDTRGIVNSIKNHLRPMNGYLLGRFAEWEYYNMDKAIEAALDLTTEIDRSSSTG